MKTSKKKRSKKKTKNINDPIKEYECDKGRISKKEPSVLRLSLEDKLGEIIDVYCVSKNEKKLAALDFSTHGKKKLMKLDKPLINKVINYCNYKNVKALHNKKIGGNYLKTIFFAQKNYKNALKLMDILWNPIYDNPESHTTVQISIGLLLGYKHKNIISFIDKLYGQKPTLTEIKMIHQSITNMDVSLEGLNKHSKIVLLETIPTI